MKWPKAALLFFIIILPLEAKLHYKQLPDWLDLSKPFSVTHPHQEDIDFYWPISNTAPFPDSYHNGILSQEGEYLEISSLPEVIPLKAPPDLLMTLIYEEQLNISHFEKMPLERFILFFAITSLLVAFCFFKKQKILMGLILAGTLLLPSYQVTLLFIEKDGAAWQLSSQNDGDYAWVRLEGSTFFISETSQNHLNVATEVEVAPKIIANAASQIENIKLFQRQDLWSQKILFIQDEREEVAR
ncbi:MAG: hypothetical protein HQL32_15965 [Planctomycetes bacterium]|nr:hypothetical protein [Planctomycetota bacterium]